MLKYQVVIIGCGISGLAAASKLIKKGIEDFVIIEAQDYVGGRINSIDYRGCPIELGAQWIHGEDENPVFDLCKHLDLIEDDDNDSSEAKMLYSTQNSETVNEEFVDHMYENFSKATEKVSRNINKLIFDIPLGDMLDKECNKYISKAEDPYLAQSVYEAYLKEERINTACENLHSLSALGWNSYSDSKGNNAISLKSNWNKVLEHLLGIVGAERVKLSEPVINIDYHSKNIEITTKKLVYIADFCICTMSLGCLKANHRRLFKPSLPKYKVEAIERIGFGVVNKFFFIFDGPVFYEGEQGLQIFWLSQLDIELESVQKWKIKNKFYKTFGSFEVLKYQPHILYSFLYGRDAVYSENLQNSCIIEIVHELLTKCFPHIKFPRIKALIRSNWHSNPYANGSYAHLRIESKTADVKALSLPINNQLFFAGEATSLDSMSTLHGAYSSGIREAQNIYERMRRRKAEAKNSVACSLV